MTFIDEQTTERKAKLHFFSKLPSFVSIFFMERSIDDHRDRW